MRFHHSTRRGRNRLAHNHGSALVSAHHHHPSGIRSLGGVGSTRWSQLGYCRETNIHFQCRQPIEPPLSSQPAECRGGREGGGARSLATCLDANRRSISNQELFDRFLNSANEDLNLIGAATNNRNQDDDLNEHTKHYSPANMTAANLRIQAASSKPQPSDPPHQARHRQQHKHRQHNHQIDDLNLHNLNLKDGATKSAGRKSAHQSPQTVSGPSQAARQKLDIESARQKLVAQVEKHPFWSNKAAKRMNLTNVEERRVYIYELISYCERRELEWRFEPYKGGLVPSTPYKRVEPDIPSTPTATFVPRPGLVYEASSISAGSAKGIESSSHKQQQQSPQRQQSPKQTATIKSKVTSSLSNQSAPGQVLSVTNSTLSMGALASPTAKTGGANLNTSTNRASTFQRTYSSVSSSHCGQQLTTSAGGTLATAAAATTSSSQKQLYEPVSALEQSHKEPSADYVWSIEVPPLVRPEPFVGCAHASELPNSSFVKRCHGCQGRGRIKCNSCYGVGYEVCISCSGKGTTKSLSAFSSASASVGAGRSTGRGGYDLHSSYSSGRNSTFANGYDPDAGDSASPFSSSEGARGRNEPGGITNSSGGGSAWVTDTCNFCHGAGQKRCWVCAGKGYNHCFGCSGTGKLRCYLNVNVTWINHRDECVLNNTDSIIPRDRLRLSSGLTLADQTSDALDPLQRLEGATGSIDEANQLEAASRRLLKRHTSNFCRQERLIKQRHRVTQILCHVVSYEWKQRKGHFVIYGDEHKVYIAKYPFKSICNIT